MLSQSAVMSVRLFEARGALYRHNNGIDCY